MGEENRIESTFLLFLDISLEKQVCVHLWQCGVVLVKIISKGGEVGGVGGVGNL